MRRCSDSIYGRPSFGHWGKRALATCRHLASGALKLSRKDGLRYCENQSVQKWEQERGEYDGRVAMLVNRTGASKMGIEKPTPLRGDCTRVRCIASISSMTPPSDGHGYAAAA